MQALKTLDDSIKLRPLRSLAQEPRAGGYKSEAKERGGKEQAGKEQAGTAAWWSCGSGVTAGRTGKEEIYNPSSSGLVQRAVHSPTMPTCQEEHGFCEKITWDELAVPLLGVPLLVVVITALVMMPLHHAWMQAVHEGKLRVPRRYLGTPSANPPDARLLNLTYSLQLVCSVAHTVLWVHRTYAREVTEVSRALEVALVVFFLIAYLLNGARFQFDSRYPISVPALIDALTIVPVFIQLSQDRRYRVLRHIASRHVTGRIDVPHLSCPVHPRVLLAS